jgi:xanthine dehydrogenase accessory factor
MNDIEFYRRIVTVLESGQNGYLVTLILSDGSTPQKAGAKMLICPDGTIHGTIGGGDVERKLIADVTESKQNCPSVIRYSLNAECQTADDPKMMCGGFVSFFIEPLTSLSQLYIIGAGHCGIELSQLAARIGFNVTVLDTRHEWANSKLHSSAKCVVCSSYDDVMQHISFSPLTYIVIMTHGHEHDEQVLRACLKQEAAYIGVIGSHRKAKALRSKLEAGGYSSVQLAHVHCPVGMDINSHTPAEIAVSIAAQLISLKNGSAADAITGI